MLIPLMVHTKFRFTLYFLGIAIMGYAQVEEHSSALVNAPLGSFSTESSDTIDLPFMDDFSYPSERPSEILWQDAKVWINDQMPLFQNSLGVATFDGLNEFGFAYKENALGSDSIA